ncbi:MAG: hypothetical protein WBD84_01915 [Methyloceanibacter sp.]
MAQGGQRLPSYFNIDRDIPIAFALMIAVAGTGYALAETQPLTRAGCEAASMPWDEAGNVCGGGVAEVPAAAAAAAMPEKKMMEPGDKKVVKKVKTSRGTKKIVKKKTAHGTTVKKKKRPFINWLKSTRNKS